MRRHLFVLTVVLGLAYADVVPICSFSRAADPAPIARVAVVNPHSPSTTPSGTSGFRERLRELGYI